MIQYVAAWFNGGGAFMWAILAVLAFAFAVTIERSIFYYLICRTRGTKLVAAAARALNSDKIQEGLEEVAIQEVPRLSERLNYLVLFANISTLLGLLGTITGLQLAFSSLGTVEASKKASMLATGISELMVCTAFGLMVAIPCMVAYTFLNNKCARLTKDLDESVVKFMNYLKKKRPA
jgi:biopolymer transport protein ExbB/TolQ